MGKFQIPLKSVEVALRFQGTTNMPVMSVFLLMEILFKEKKEMYQSLGCWCSTKAFYNSSEGLMLQQRPLSNQPWVWSLWILLDTSVEAPDFLSLRCPLLAAMPCVAHPGWDWRQSHFPPHPQGPGSEASCRSQAEGRQLHPSLHTSDLEAWSQGPSESDPFSSSFPKAHFKVDSLFNQSSIFKPKINSVF